MRHGHFRADDAGPNIPDCNPSELIEQILVLLEDAGCPQEVNDQVVRLIEQWEHSQRAELFIPDFEAPEEPPMEMP